MILVQSGDHSIRGVATVEKVKPQNSMVLERSGHESLSARRNASERTNESDKSQNLDDAIDQTTEEQKLHTDDSLITGTEMFKTERDFGLAETVGS